MKQSRESFFLCSYEKKQLQLPRFYEKEMDALFESAQGEQPLDLRNQALLEVLYGTGIRVSECANLTVDAVDFQASVLLVHGKEIRPLCAFWFICTRRLKGLLREWPRAINDKISKTSVCLC